ncbi:hypothetical protein COLO4_19406 [Corchorus olitorius]|uniref:Uncharacterized protein n=1 Tax=Corchorus olitorius TaxID=93759 RepID=A0A1R3J5I5_9ROSI|nr:hypothetical protein COLO4_19406 [Corchorus olitorius]
MLVVGSAVCKSECLQLVVEVDTKGPSSVLEGHLALDM